MTRYYFIAAALLFVAFLSVTSAWAQNMTITAPSIKPQPLPAGLLEVGTVAPDFSLNSQEGKSVDLHDYKNKWVVLYFYPKDFTSGCTAEAHGFQADLDKYTGRNAVILGVSVDPTSSHKDFCAKEGLSFKLLADTDHIVTSAYGSLRKFGPIVIAARNTYIINPDGKIARVFANVRPVTHSKEVLAALDELQAHPAVTGAGEPAVPVKKQP